MIVFAPFSPCGRRVGDEGFGNGFGSWHGWRRAGREGCALDRDSPALRAGASNFSLRGQRKVTKRKTTCAFWDSTYSRFSQNEVRQSQEQIQFDDVGAKWLVAAYARLEAQSSRHKEQKEPLAPFLFIEAWLGNEESETFGVKGPVNANVRLE
ncbi:hypothetical protein KBAD11_01940 [Aeromonas dhakensis]|uniref:hypothetical protein n=1 Tax=Aeromonas TaxID=642 RepID=UPI0021FBA623|nr:hypothetical protein [Aeromonas sp. QDB20]CAD7489431.1 hypothetical protein KBAD45_01940 [Aeromonas dhakensis]CAD7493873.1 hypothetical protein KBAD59_01950 [Aeromonas dhakensis]CAD7493976.1 hypothetical protein KBAD11_01940 [Aeromonas dhakensis]CAD7496519.1 hypothetical protein KBAD14_KBAD14_01950 [Aeromonas dhakensis]CAD7496589.1 hypothetical protein KBAD10_01950 [Aeromonas dhakensis]